MSEQDSLRRFVFELHHIRGVWVHLDASYLAVRDKHTYPMSVGRLLGEGLAASALLAASLQFEGGLSLQIQTPDYLQLLLAKCTHDGHIRGLAHYDESSPAPALDRLISDGNLMITIDQTSPTKNRYQGIVACQDHSLSQSIENYFAQSEQLSTRLWLQANDKMVGGLLLQQIPGQGEHDDEAWQNIVMLTETLTDEELLQEDSAQLLLKLYHEHQVRVFEPELISFRCHCSYKRMENALQTMSYEEVKAVLQAHNKVEVTCEFCRSHFVFDSVDIERIYKSGMSGSASDPAH